MRAPSKRPITQLLRRWSQGDRDALNALAPLVHKELHRLARAYMANERPGHTLQTTALINEAYARLIDWKSMRWKGRAHFFAVAARVMRQVLVDHARSRSAGKRGRSLKRVSLDEEALFSLQQSRQFIALDDALSVLEAMDPRKCQVVEMRFFGGLSVEETADVLKVSPRTVMRDWSLARAWLYRELRG